MLENKLVWVRHLCFEIWHIRLPGGEQLAVDPYHRCTRHSLNISFSSDNSHIGVEKLLCTLYIAQLPQMFLLLLRFSCSFKSYGAIVCWLMVLLHQWVDECYHNCMMIKKFFCNLAQPKANLKFKPRDSVRVKPVRRQLAFNYHRLLLLLLLPLPEIMMHVLESVFKVRFWLTRSR